MILTNRRLFTALLTTLTLCTFSTSQADEEEAKRIVPVITWLLEDVKTDAPGFSSGSFIAEDGLIVVEMESLDLPQGWAARSDDNSAIGSYVEWTDSNSLQTPGNGTISLNVVISDPGTYRFIWRNSIRNGSSTTDANDSFLKILADSFYGFRPSDQSIVCPREQPASNACIGGPPEGASADGWFKVYRSGGTPPDWRWSASTSDSDAHGVYADFNSVGEYEIQISGRSRFHAIDRFVLFRSRNNTNNVSESFATNSNRPESSRIP